MNEQTNACVKCGGPAEFGYKIEGEQQWFCEQHRLAHYYADARRRISAAAAIRTSKKTQAAIDAFSLGIPQRPETLAWHAEAIRALGKRAVRDLIEIGRRLTEAKDLCGHGNWLAWLEHEFRWSDDTARNYMRCYQLSKSRTVRNLEDLDLPLRGLYLLARPSTPETARQEVIERVASGEEISHAQVKATVTKAKQSLPNCATSAERPERTAIRQDLIDQAMTLIRQMDSDTWRRFDRIYQKERDDLGVEYF